MLSQPMGAPAQNQALIPLDQATIDGQTVQTVHARELHAFLEVGKMFAHWIKDRIEAYNFQENQDFVVFAKTGKNPQGGRPAVEYWLTLDMAKELAMLERNDKGKLARKYFIECERRLRERSPALPDFTNPAEAAKAWAAEYERAQIEEAKVKELEAQRQVMEPKASFYDQVMEAGNAVQVRIAAKTIGIGPKALWDYLQDKKWVYRVDGRLTARQDKLKQGLLDTKLTSFMHPDKGRVATTICLVTPKGLDRLQKELGGLPLFDGGQA